MFDWKPWAALSVILGLFILLVYLMGKENELRSRNTAYCESHGMQFLELADRQLVGKTTTTKSVYFCLTTDGKLIVIPDGVQAQSQ